jgi:DNA-binding MarR family transcriptional regulator
MSTMDRESIDSVLRTLRRVNLQGSLFGQTVAIRFGLSESDVEALEVLLDSGAATTAGKLSDLMGLTTGAVTRVIDRLEQAGYVRRVPDPTDRRRVVVELIPDRMAAVEATMARVGETSAREIGGHYSEAELAVINDFLTRMEAITRQEAEALRGGADGGADESSQHVAPIGGLTRARLLVKAGAHELLIRGFSDPDDLYRATSNGRVPHVRLRDGTVTIGYKGRWLWDALDRRTDVLLNRQVPWDIELGGGAGKLQGKLADVDLRSFQLSGGVDQLRLTLGRPTGEVALDLIQGVNKVRIERPVGVPVRLVLKGGAGRIDFDSQRVDGTGDTTLTSGSTDETADRYVLTIKGGAGKITITEVD